MHNELPPSSAETIACGSGQPTNPDRTADGLARRSAGDLCWSPSAQIAVGLEFAVRRSSAVVERVGRPVAVAPSPAGLAGIPEARLPADIGPEEIAAIVQRRADGGLVADIGRAHGLSPLGVLHLLRAVRNGERDVPSEVVEMAVRALSRAAQSGWAGVR